MKFIFTVMLSLFSYLTYGQMGSLEIKVTNFKEGKGQLIISIFDNANDFPIKDKEWKRILLDIDNTEHATTQLNLPKGEYAIALLHDLNLDGECNFNFLRIPTEAYGFSQNVRPIISVPSFNETSFRVTGNESIEIELIQ